MNLNQHSLSLVGGLDRVDARLAAVSARVSSGRRIDRPAADSAGLGQAAKLDSEQTRLRAAEVNIQNGVSRLQVTGGHLNALGRIVTRLSELSTLGANSLHDASDQSLYAAEFTQLQDQLRQIIGGSVAEIGGRAPVDRPLGNFNDRALFGPGPGDTLAVGPAAEDRLTLPVLNLRTGALGDLIRQDSTGAFTLAFGSATGASTGATLRAALTQIADGQAAVGAGQSRLTLAASVATTAAANHEAALAAIQDTDIAAETTELARLQMVNGGHTAMLAQARDVTAKLLPLLSRR